jgi:hypothetical protein
VPENTVVAGSGTDSVSFYYFFKDDPGAGLEGGGPHCLDSLMDGISSESIVKFFMKHQAASANG